MPDTYTVCERSGATSEQSADVAVPPVALRAIEARADVESLTDLHRQRRQLMNVLAPLAALHGNFGKWDAKRSQMFKAMEVKARLGLMAMTGKATDKAVEAQAGDDEQYVRFVDDGITGHIEYLRLNNDLQDLNDRIRSREVELGIYNAELRLAR
jgi:hypothetical protein